MEKDNRLAVVGITVITEETASMVNDILSDFGNIIVGRMEYHIKIEEFP